VIATVVGIVLVVPRLSLAQWELTDGNDQLSRVSIAYIPPSNSTFQALYEVLKDHRALKKIQEILSPLRWPEELTIKTAECGVVNSWYGRENFKPTVTICYEFLNTYWIHCQTKRRPTGSRAPMPQSGQFLWVALDEVGHAPQTILRHASFCNLARIKRAD
jgi:hypothetical protein